MKANAPARRLAFRGKAEVPLSAVSASLLHMEKLGSTSDLRPRPDGGKVAGNTEIAVIVGSDELLIEQLRDGDHGALAPLFRRYAQMVRVIARRIVGDTAEADDVLQEVFLFIYRRCALYDPARGSTCRTQFFATEEEIPKETGVMIVAPRQLGEPAMYEFWKLYISPLTDDQIARFLRLRFPLLLWTKRREAFNLITKIPQLTVRPMLLAYLPDIMGADLKIEYSFELYEIMVAKWLKRESGWIEPQQLRDFSDKLAIDLYSNRERRGAERLPPSELSILLPTFNSELDGLDRRSTYLFFFGRFASC